MSDLIDRQAAIDALRAMQTYKLFAGDDMLLIDQAGAQTELMMLPPAQPEPHWIPVTERLPEIGEYVLCMIRQQYRGQFHVCHYVDKDKYHDHPYFDWWHNGFPDVVAWMPLPKPYKGEVTE